jgi:uncharacterized protein YndB with AHSA1/START domain
VEIIDTFGFNAPAEVVYNTLIDPDRTDRWLPAGTRVAERADGRVRLASGTSMLDFEVRTTAADMLLTFECVAPVRLRGTARVTETPAGGSQIEIVVTTDRSGPDPEAVRRVVTDTARRLERDVDDNFTAG